MQWDSAVATWTIPWHADGAHDQFYSDFTDIMIGIEDTIARQLWCMASRHENGSDLRDGADTYQVPRELRGLRRLGAERGGDDRGPVAS
eukprot:5708736-Pyramimonas_sp.AAC.1